MKIIWLVLWVSDYDARRAGVHGAFADEATARRTAAALNANPADRTVYRCEGWPIL
jgi:hypothetical protein